MESRSDTRYPSPIMSEEELARLVNRYPSDRYRLAPYAYDSRGRLLSAYRHVIFARDQHGNKIMTPAQIKAVTVQFAKTIEGLTEEEIRMQTPNTSRKRTIRSPQLIKIGEDLLLPDEIPSATASTLSCLELAKLGNLTVYNRREKGKGVWKTAGDLHPQFYALVFEEEYPGKLVMTSKKQALALSVEENELELALSMLRQALIQKAWDGWVDAASILPLDTFADTITADEDATANMNRVARNLRIDATRKTEYIENLRFQRIQQAKSSTSVVLERVNILGPGELILEEMTEAERFDMGHDDKGTLLLRHDVFHSRKGGGGLPRVTRLASNETQGALRAFMQLTLNEIGCNNGRGKTYFVSALKHRERFATVQSADLVYVNEIWTEHQQSGFFQLEPALRMRMFLIECLAPGKPVLPVRVLFAVSNHGVESQVRRFARPLASCVLLFLNMIPHVMWSWEYEEHCTHFSSRQLHDDEHCDQFFLVEENLKWLETKKVFGGDGIMKALENMSFDPQKQHENVICFARDILLWRGNQYSTVQPGDDSTSSIIPDPMIGSARHKFKTATTTTSQLHTVLPESTSMPTTSSIYRLDARHKLSSGIGLTMMPSIPVSGGNQDEVLAESGKQHLTLESENERLRLENSNLRDERNTLINELEFRFIQLWRIMQDNPGMVIFDDPEVINFGPDSAAWVKRRRDALRKYRLSKGESTMDSAVAGDHV